MRPRTLPRDNRELTTPEALAARQSGGSPPAIDLKDPSVLQDMRQVVDNMTQVGSAPAGVLEQPLIIEARDGHSLDCLLLRPTHHETGPLIVSIHGGG